MVATLHTTMTTWKADYEHKTRTFDLAAESEQNLEEEDETQQEEDIIDFVSPYTIINQTGYPIELQADQAEKTQGLLAEKVYMIPNCGSIQYKIESDIEGIIVKKNLDDFLINTNKVKVHVLHPNHQFENALGVDIDRPNVVVHQLWLKGGKHIKNHLLVSDVRIINQKKIITLTSPYKIKNHVDHAFQITFEAPSQELTVTLAPEETISVPMDYLEGFISVDNQMNKRTISEFFSLEKKTTEIQAGDKVILAEKKALDDAKQVHKVTLRPPVQIKNCFIADFKYKLSSEVGLQGALEKELKPQESVQEVGLSLASKIYIEVWVSGYKWSEKVLIHSPVKKDSVVKKVKLVDEEGQNLWVEIFVVGEKFNEEEKQEKAKKFFFYTQTCIVNETPYELEYFLPDHGKNTKAPGQAANRVDLLKQRKAEEVQYKINSRLLMMNETKSLVISRKETEEISKEVNVAAVGDTVAELRSPGGSSMVEFGINMALWPCDHQYGLITKVITISPRYILINKTACELDIKLEKTAETLLTLEKEVRVPLRWTNGLSNEVENNEIKEKKDNKENCKRNICVRYLDPFQDAEYWDWSNGFDITAIGTYHFFTRNKIDETVKYFKSTVSLNSSIIYVTIEEENPQEIIYKVQNDCEDLTIRIHQASVNPKYAFTLGPKQSMPWAWVYPDKKKEVSVHFFIDNLINYHSSDLRFSFDTLNKHFEKKIPMTRDRLVKRTVCVDVVLQGNIHLIKFSDPLSATAKRVLLFKTLMARTLSLVTNLDVEIGIKSLGLSIISSVHNKIKGKKERKELLYLLAKGIELRILETNENRSSQVRVKYLNIDNNTIFDTSYPVLLTPTFPGDLGDYSKQYFLDILIVKKHATEVNFYDTIEVLLDDTSLNVDGPFLEVILGVAETFSKIFAVGDQSTDFGSISEGLYKNSKTALKLQEEGVFESKMSWKKPSFQEYQGNLFIKNLKIHPLFFNLSFKLKKANTTENLFIVLNLLTGALGTALANLDNAPLSLTGIELHDVFDSQEAIVAKIVSKYKNEVTKNVFKLLGSLDIVGNPVGLFNNISTGVTDLFEKPVQGFLKGPLEGGKGLLTGAGSLVKNTVSGTFNSISKVTGSLASGVSNLSLDDEYLEEREKDNVKRPKHIGQGLWQGGVSLAKGIFGGVTGLFVKPVQGVASGGCKGLARGTYQGVSGLVIKPVAGVLDATSKTAEGVKNTVTFWDQKTNEERMRCPRPFYGKEKFYKVYRDLDAEILKALRDKQGEGFNPLQTEYINIDILL